MISMLTGALEVDENQAEGGLGSIFNYAKGNLPAGKFTRLSEALPGVNKLFKLAPDISTLTNAKGLDGLLDKAAQYNGSLKAINDVKKTV